MLNLIVDINEAGETCAVFPLETETKEEVHDRLVEMLPPRKGHRRVAFIGMYPKEVSDNVRTIPVEVVVRRNPMLKDA